MRKFVKESVCEIHKCGHNRTFASWWVWFSGDSICLTGIEQIKPSDDAVKACEKDAWRMWREFAKEDLDDVEIAQVETLSN